MAAVCDVNFLLAFAVDTHTHHKDVLLWLNTKTSGEVVVCRVAQIGFLRLLNTPAVMKEGVLDTDACWAAWVRLLNDGHFSFDTTEPQALDAKFSQFTNNKKYSPRLWTDAYLAAFACANDHTLITFDRGFTRFEGLKHEILG